MVALLENATEEWPEPLQNESQQTRVHPYIRLEKVSVRIFERSLATTLKRRFVRGDSAAAAPRAVTILEDIDLEVAPGDRLGILGRNGSGKSSLLKTIAGIYPIVSGVRVVEGQVTPVMSNGVGFDPELTVRENVRLGLIYAGRYGDWSPELEAKILDFAEVAERAGDQLKLLSSGFQGRLAFAVCLFQRPEILILDETLAAGDFAFFDKARTAMLAQIESTPITILVSHDENQIRQVCNRCILLSQGRLVGAGSPEQMLTQYHRAAAA